MKSYLYLLGILLLINIVKLSFNKNKNKNAVFLIWKLLFNNLIICAAYYYTIYSTNIKINNLENYFIGIIIFQILLITVVRDCINYIKRSNNSMLIKLILFFKFGKSKKQIKTIIDYLNEDKDD